MGLTQRLDKIGRFEIGSIVIQKGGRAIRMANPAKLLKCVDQTLEEIMSYHRRPTLLEGD